MKTREPNLSAKASGKEIIQANRSCKKIATAAALGNMVKCARTRCAVVGRTVAIKRSPKSVARRRRPGEPPLRHIACADSAARAGAPHRKAIGFVIEMSWSEALLIGCQARLLC